MIKAVYPGSFDPFHFGHLDIAKRASQLFDELIVAIYAKPSKNLLFTTAERIELVYKSTQNLPNVSIITYTGLTIDCARNADAQVIVRGLRNVADFQYEHQLGWANNHLANDIETCCLFCNKEYAYLSSTILKEVASLGGDYSAWASTCVREALSLKFANHLSEASELVNSEDSQSLAKPNMTDENGTGDAAGQSSDHPMVQENEQDDDQIPESRVGRRQGRLSYRN